MKYIYIYINLGCIILKKYLNKDMITNKTSVNIMKSDNIYILQIYSYHYIYILQN